MSTVIRSDVYMCACVNIQMISIAYIIYHIFHVKVYIYIQHILSIYIYIHMPGTGNIYLYMVVSIG